MSLDLPLVLFCLSHRSSLLAAFEQSEHFAVNVLAIGQQTLSNRFARPSLNDWEGVKYHTGAHGCVLLAGALGSLECAKRAVYPGGDHLSLVGEVVRVQSARLRAAGVLSGRLRHLHTRPVGRHAATG